MEREEGGSEWGEGVEREGETVKAREHRATRESGSGGSRWQQQQQQQQQLLAAF